MNMKLIHDSLSKDILISLSYARSLVYDLIKFIFFIV